MGCVWGHSLKVLTPLPPNLKKSQKTQPIGWNDERKIAPIHNKDIFHFHILRNTPPPPQFFKIPESLNRFEWESSGVCVCESKH